MGVDSAQPEWEHEYEDLKKELKHFLEEKERVRQIVGRVGGVPQFNTKLFNTAFVGLLVAMGIISLFVHSSAVRLVLIEITTVALSVKILYMMHCQAKVNHFQLWMLSSVEWRMNEMMKMVRRLGRSRADASRTNHGANRPNDRVKPGNDQAGPVNASDEPGE